MYHATCAQIFRPDLVIFRSLEQDQGLITQVLRQDLEAVMQYVTDSETGCLLRGIRDDAYAMRDKY